MTHTHAVHVMSYSTPVTLRNHTFHDCLQKRHDHESSHTKNHPNCWKSYSLPWQCLPTSCPACQPEGITKQRRRHVSNISIRTSPRYYTKTGHSELYCDGVFKQPHNVRPCGRGLLCVVSGNGTWGIPTMHFKLIIDKLLENIQLAKQAWRLLCCEAYDFM